MSLKLLSWYLKDSRPVTKSYRTVGLLTKRDLTVHPILHEIYSKDEDGNRIIYIKL